MEIQKSEEKKNIRKLVLSARRKTNPQANKQQTSE